MTEVIAAPLPSLEAYGPLEDALAWYRENDRPSWREMVRRQAEADLYFSLRYVFVASGGDHQRFPDGKRYIEHEFAYEMATSTQFDHDDVMLMAARGHGKSTTVTFGLNLWSYIRDPQGCSVIWSVTRNLAKEHLQEIKDELEGNELLYELWPDRFWKDRHAIRQAGKSWSIEYGLSMPLQPPGKEKTFEAWGLTDVAFPTGKHFRRHFYDDVVDERCVTSPEMIAAARDTYNRSSGCDHMGGSMHTHVGTPYADNDTGVQLVREGIVKLRCRPAVDASRQDTENRRKIGGRPVFMSEEQLLLRLKRMGASTYSIQMLMDAHKGRSGTLPVSNIRYYQKHPMEERTGKNVYICVDPNGGFHPTRNDACAITVWGLGPDKNFYLLDAFRGHLDTGARHQKTIELRAIWEPISVRIEEVTSAADSYHLKAAQERMSHRFEVESIHVQTMKKGSGLRGEYTRVQRLTDAWQPVLSECRLYLPEKLMVEVEGEKVDLSAAFFRELKRFPIGETDDLISSGALLFEDHGQKRGAQPLIWPAPTSRLEQLYPYLHTHHRQRSGARSWMGVG